MDIKIIELKEFEKDVCIHRGRNGAEQEVVTITAFLLDNDGDEYIFETEIVFPDALTAGSFVNDYSDVSATDWFSHRAFPSGILRNL